MKRYKKFSSRSVRNFTIAGLGAILVAAGNSFAQSGEMSYFFDGLNMKNYALTEVHGQDQYFSTGTIYQYPYTYGGLPPVGSTSDALHCTLIDYQGIQIFSNVFDDPDYDERAVGVHEVNGDLITVYGRTKATEKGLGVLRLDASGNSISSEIMVSTQPGFEDLYPLGSLKYDDHTLFICGVALARGATLDFVSSKASFIVRYDLDDDKIVDQQLYNTGPAGGVDLDMILRLKRTSNGDLWAGGSVNDGPMLNMVVNPNNLAHILTQHNFGGVTYPNYMEYSFDMVETGTNIFIFGNSMYYSPLSPAATFPMFMNINAVTNSFIPYPTDARWQFGSFDYAWGINTIADVSSDTVILGGMATNLERPATPQTSTNNVNPFIFKMALSYDTQINVTQIFWNTVLSYAGTGNPGQDPSAYLASNGYVNTVEWGPLNMARDTASTTDIVLTTPIWNSNTNNLNIKFVRTDANAEVNGCEVASDVIESGIENVYTGQSATRMPFTYQQGHPTMTSTSLLPDRVENCGGVYKHLHTNNDYQKAGTASILPNPATSDITLQWTADKPAKNIALTISDVTGKVVIHKTVAQEAGANTVALKVDDLIAGIYFFRIGTMNGKFIKH